MHAHNMCSTNIKGSKKIWVPKVEKSSYDANINSFSSSDIPDEINMFYSSTPTREEISLNMNL